MGFTKIIRKRDGKIVDNDQAQGSGREMDKVQDGRIHGRNAFHPDPDYSSIVPIAYARNFQSGGNNLFGVSDIRIEIGRAHV